MKADLTKHTINLRDGDMAYISEVFQTKAVPASQIIRQLVSSYLDTLRARERFSSPEPTTLTIPNFEL